VLVSLTTLTPTMQDALRRLVAAITDHDGISPINESASMGIEGLREADFFFMGRRSDPYGFVVCDERDGTLLLGVHPDHRSEGVGAELLREALRAHPDSAVWAFGTLPGGDSLARRLGLFPVRTLLRMERPLEGADLTAEVLDGYRIVTYTPDLAADLLKLNVQAFAHHPEQGRLTAKEFEDLTRQPWFDPAGFFVAMHGSEVAGLHWTKRHDGGLGEVYLIAVAPGHEGKGLGRALLARGLAHLASLGDHTVQLYVEGDQERVVRMYANAGFTVVQTDTSYRRER
jgi:mycothiol synthase